MNTAPPGETLHDELEPLRMQLAPHLEAPQSSERWAMYRLIIPIVDLANSRLDLTPHFEFGQTSAHGTSQSVDIALLDGDTPIAMIEAKRAGRRIGSDQISKYLPAGVRGIVTDGFYWILCLNHLSRPLSLWDAESKTMNVHAVREIVSFIRGTTQPDENWSNSTQYVDAVVRPDKPSKERTAVRRSNMAQPAVSLGHCEELLSELVKATDSERVFLRSLFISMRQSLGEIPIGCEVQFRSSRVVFFKKATSTPSKRVGRIDLGKTHPDILVSAEIVDNTPELDGISSSSPHDKGPHMRRFRLATTQQCKQYGATLGRVIFQ